MATIKSYTTIEQSRKLADILPLESADMCYKCLGEDPYDIVMRPYTDWKEEYKGLLISGDANVFPCWSLAALLNVIPGGQVNRMANSDKWETSSWNDSDYEPAYYVEDYDNPVDACVAMIEKLHELKML